MLKILPCGVDRGDGQVQTSGSPTGVRVGTPPDAGQFRYSGPGVVGNVEDMPIEEHPDSPTMERSEYCTVSKKFHGPYQALLDQWSALFRGVFRVDSYGNKTRVLSSKISSAGDYMGDLEVVEEMQSDVPPDTFSVHPVEMGVNILKFPRYFYWLDGEGDAAKNSYNQQVIRSLQNYFDNPSPPLRNKIPTSIYESLNNLTGTGTDKIAGTNMAKRAALEIISKFWKGEETPYVVGVQMTWTAFYFTQQPMNFGGYVTNNPALTENQQLPPEFYYYTDAGGQARNLFDMIAAWNPQSYSANGLPSGQSSISWMRQADDPSYERLTWRWPRTWIGAPIGHWDNEFYNAPKRPQVEGDFLNITPTDIPTF